MNQNIKNMRRLTFLMLVFTGLLPSCSVKPDKSSVLEFLSDNVEVEPYSPFSDLSTDQVYLKVVDGSAVYYFNNVIPDTLGFAVDTINKFVTKEGAIVDTLWLTKDYAEFGDTTSEGFKEIFIPVEKYNRGHNAPPFNFIYQVRKTKSGGGSLDIAGSYKRGSATIIITKISTGNFVLSNGVNPPRKAPVIAYVDGDNKVSIPDTKIGAYQGSAGALTIRQSEFFKIRYSQIGGSPGAGDTLVYTYKRTDNSALNLVKLIRQ